MGDNTRLSPFSNTGKGGMYMFSVQGDNLVYGSICYLTKKRNCINHRLLIINTLLSNLTNICRLSKHLAKGKECTHFRKGSNFIASLSKMLTILASTCFFPL